VVARCCSSAAAPASAVALSQADIAMIISEPSSIAPNSSARLV
jgi:hypothetical protein